MGERGCRAQEPALEGIHKETNSVNAIEAEIDLADALAESIAGMLAPVR